MQKKLKLMTDFIINGVGAVDDKMLMALGAPYSEKSVKIEINPSLSYTNTEGKEYLEAKYTPNTKKFTFNLTNNATKKIKVAGLNYTITLTDIGKIKKQNKDYDLYFKFLINRE